ncbi:hypothetical protein KAFR_0H02140 [Kazachstania africana CBS 2517]|uniref:glucan endo-1,3-beta-D-glucosidase n=1 Tax=Kazachstania africana (strain ATCC 22294 / BCRC 22015 / CBS 2517 / CECT 1963 / NBRC 1671 / NRRL Y-8276) TaxID=1071382 RepID=H2AZ67_KAZAF|nr:hypothetical protein KAFR_0H02140 [Kazachstania africana CBS 2517]CCF59623.1 hypothetical protein KAFR_0H02140 [Kazachstania africana CBS 2517]
MCISFQSAATIPGPRDKSLSALEAQFDATNVVAIDFDTPISTSKPASFIPRVAHAVSLPYSLIKSENNNSIETNKFYGNMLLGGQTNPVWTHPYSLWFNQNDPASYGIGVSYVQNSQKVFDTTKSPPGYFFSPTFIQSFLFGAKEFTTKPYLNFQNMKHTSVQLNVKLSDARFIKLPLIQGMGFVTAIYQGLTPNLKSAVGFKTFTKISANKYQATLENGVTWTIYVSGNYSGFTLSLLNGNTVQGNKSMNNCVIQIIPSTKTIIDSVAGSYPIDMTISASVSSYIGTYSLNYTTNNGNDTLLYALPHQYNNFTSSSKSTKINDRLTSTVSGTMEGVIAKQLNMILLIPSTVDFNVSAKMTNLPQSNLNTILAAATQEVKNANVPAESNLDSMYFSGKVLQKYAWLLYVCHFILKNSALTSTLLPQLQTAITRFITNTQILPLNYDTTWNGLISSGKPEQDFGNPYYNDHHFHYGYHVMAIALTSKVALDIDPKSQWPKATSLWCQYLIRDYSNPSIKDPYFPVFRSFDWFHGHSWAKGLYESGDGKDQESTSEDVNSIYAIKLWAIVNNNTNLVNMANIQLGIINSSINSYFLYLDTNTIEPPQFVPNKVSGILFENKIDHTTYFGTNTEYIHMIHALPLIPITNYIRSAKFAKQEWNQVLSKIIDKIPNNGWKSVIMLEIASFDAKSSWNYFAQSNFFSNYGLDDGQSLTWSLTYAASLLS